ncbi:tetratricopeptide repeat protein [Myxococcota bacterium]|nr:tetratricopeptide repeat protein [Myxococcota bacterium]
MSKEGMTPWSAALRWTRPVLGLGLVLAWLSGCQTHPPAPSKTKVEPMRISQALGQGDPARRASIRLVVQGLDEDEAGRPQRARGSYERALQVDPTNPYAYLAMARHELELGESQDALDFIEQAAALFESEGQRRPEVGVHLIGLRAEALRAGGRDQEAQLYFETAGELAPEIWGDGALSPSELR